MKIRIDSRTHLGKLLYDGDLWRGDVNRTVPLAQIVPLEVRSTKEIVAGVRDSLDPQTSRKIARRLRAVERILDENRLSIDAVQLRDADGGRHALALEGDAMSDRPLDEKPKQEPKPLLIGAKPAALMLGISRTTLDLLVRKGEIPCVRLGGRVLFSVAVLEAIARGEGRTK